MLRQAARLVDTGLKLLDLAILSAAFPVAYFVRDRFSEVGLPGLFQIEFYWPILAVTLLLWIGAARVMRVYEPYRTRGLGTELGRIVRCLAIIGGLVAAASFVTKQSEISRLFVGFYFGTALILLVASRLSIRVVARRVRKGGHNTRSFAVVGTGELAQEIVASLTRRKHWGLTFAGHVLAEGDTPRTGAKVLGRLEDLGTILETQVLDEVIFVVSRERLDAIEAAMLVCEELGVAARVCLDFFPRRLAQMSLEEMDGMPFLTFSTAPSDSLALLLKRMFDLTFSLVTLVIFSPLLLIIGLAVKLESPGPVLFRQRRVGLNGREFMLYKFRSMRADAEAGQAALSHRNEMNGPVFKLSDDPRVTRVGRILRKASLDELPQFWNVLRGEMSVVGPRPPIPAEVKRYERRERRRLSMKPGITCVWQVSGRSDIDFDRWVQLDLAYIDNWSFWRDMKIVLKTIPAVIWGRGAR
jgi:exopolysaccharide biosynthesis polyprenyl glycosylphosphotransferase